jgi:hypothetical protein
MTVYFSRKLFREYSQGVRSSDDGSVLPDCGEAGTIAGQVQAGEQLLDTLCDLGVVTAIARTCVFRFRVLLRVSQVRRSAGAGPPFAGP